MQDLAESGLPAGILTTDLGYSQAYAEDYALPIRALGYELMHMFKSDQLGSKETEGGFKLIEGTIYGPCIPRALEQASIDYQKGRIDEQLYLERIEARRPYEARLKARKDGSYAAVYRCPGAGTSRTVNCQYKPVPGAQERAEASSKRRPLLPVIVNPPKNLPACCSNKESVSLSRDFGARMLTKYPYKTPEWQRYYSNARNEMEGFNEFTKNAVDAAIATTEHRRFRGFGKQLLVVLVKLAASNITILLNWHDNQDGVEPDARRGRPPKPRLEQHLPEPNAPPFRILAEPREDKFKVES